jgi:hypothetical protein
MVHDYMLGERKPFNDLIAGRLPDTTLAAARLREELVEFSQIFVQAYRPGFRWTPVQPLPSRDHPTGDLALCPVHLEFP